MDKLYQELIRVESSDEGTFGIWKIFGKIFCNTLEETQKSVTKDSKIPAGTYICKRRPSAKVTDMTKGKWRETFEITGVAGRTDVLIHQGNTLGDTEGCILMGENWGKLKGDRAVLNSGVTFDRFMTLMVGINQFTLNIKEVA